MTPHISNVYCRLKTMTGGKKTPEKNIKCQEKVSVIPVVIAVVFPLAGVPLVVVQGSSSALEQL